jgi:hypothetical protein
MALLAALEACAPTSAESADAVVDRLLGAWARADEETGEIDWTACARQNPVQHQGSIVSGRVRPGDVFFERDDEGDLWAQSGVAGVYMTLSEAEVRPRGGGWRLRAWGQTYDLAFGARTVDGVEHDTLTMTWTGASAYEYVNLRCPDAAKG